MLNEEDKQWISELLQDMFQGKLQDTFQGMLQELLRRHLEPLAAEIQHLATREQLEARLLATREELEAKLLATREQLEARIELLATREELEARIEPLATREQLEAVETRLLTEFHKWASPFETKQRSHSAAIQALDAHMKRSAIGSRGSRTARAFCDF